MPKAKKVKVSDQVRRKLIFLHCVELVDMAVDKRIARLRDAQYLTNGERNRLKALVAKARQIVALAQEVR
jgi:hypothetical protein